jgi:hypothetical protein
MKCGRCGCEGGLNEGRAISYAGGGFGGNCGAGIGMRTRRIGDGRRVGSGVDAEVGGAA